MAQQIWKIHVLDWLEQLTKVSTLTPARTLILQVRSQILNLRATVYRLQVDGKTIRIHLAPIALGDTRNADLSIDLPRHLWREYGLQTKEPDHVKFSFFYPMVPPNTTMPIEFRVDISSSLEIADAPDFDTPVQ